MEARRLGYWLSEKKSKKLSLTDIEASLLVRNVHPIKIDLDKPLEEQGPFDGILHKLTDYIASAEGGDKEAVSLISRVERYVKQNPKMVMIDSIEALRALMNRYRTYSITQEATKEMKGMVFVPQFVALESEDFERNVKILKNVGISYPAICKPIVAHGSNAHQMTLIFNDEGLKEVTYPCVVQSFVNHNALLYKLFNLGNKYFLIERPSIKNFTNCDDNSPIHFDGNAVSKANSISNLNVQDNDTIQNGVSSSSVQPSSNIFFIIVREIAKVMGLQLFGVDVVVEASTGKYAIVDVNAFPGYDGVANFSDELADYIRQQLDGNKPEIDDEVVGNHTSSSSNSLANGEII